jgi:hypothetical protein
MASVACVVVQCHFFVGLDQMALIAMHPESEMFFMREPSLFVDGKFLVSMTPEAGQGGILQRG